MAVAVLAAVAAAATIPVGGLFVPQPPRPDEVRRAVAAAPISTIHSAWIAMSKSGLSRTPSPQEVRFGKFTRATRGVSRGLWGVAAVAAIVSAAAFASRASSRRHEAKP